MSTAARKVRKRTRQLVIEASAEVSDTVEGRRAFVEAEAPAYQHPQRYAGARSVPTMSTPARWDDPAVMLSDIAAAARWPR